MRAMPELSTSLFFTLIAAIMTAQAADAKPARFELKKVRYYGRRLDDAC